MSDKEHHEEGGSHGGGGHGKGGGHGGGSHEEHEGVPEWMISFADNTALMMGLFVILLALNMAKTTVGGIGGDEKMGGSPSAESAEVLDWVLSVREAFHNPVNSNGTDPAEEALRERIRERQRMSEGEADNPGPEGKHRETEATPPTNWEHPGATVPFNEGAGDLSPRAREIVAEACRKLKGQRWIIEVRGFASPYETFDQHVKSRRLSYSRAEAVAEAMVEEGLRWEQLRLVAAGDSRRRVAAPLDRTSDAPNRRVEIVVTHETEPDDLHRSPELRPADAEGTEGEAREEGLTESAADDPEH
jgi:outer membrane protein OmpA-like peptidoglycan-associated protein